MMKHVAALTFALLLLLAGPAVAIAQEYEFVEVTAESPIEAMLVAIDQEGVYVSPSDVREYAELLDRAAAKCPEDRKYVAGLAIEVHRLLKDREIYMPTREMLRVIDETFGNEYDAEDSRYRPTCTDVIARAVRGRLAEK